MCVKVQELLNSVTNSFCRGSIRVVFNTDDFSKVLMQATKQESNRKDVILRSIPLFQTFPSESMKRVADICQLKEFPANTVIIQEGEVSDNIFFLVSVCVNCGSG